MYGCRGVAAFVVWVGYFVVGRWRTVWFGFWLVLFCYCLVLLGWLDLLEFCNWLVLVV